MVENNQSISQNDRPNHRGYVGVLFTAIALVCCLRSFGRVWWCQQGDLTPFSWDVWSPHNSQHLLDPYALSHVEHGVIFGALLLCLGGSRLSKSAQFLIVAVVEASWEIAENTPYMINRYRETTISLDYVGDSVINSLGDLAVCLLGVAIARKLSLAQAILLTLALEIACIVWIRDSLFLNVIMLISPSETIRAWQSAA